MNNEIYSGGRGTTYYDSLPSCYLLSTIGFDCGGWDDSGDHGPHDDDDDGQMKAGQVTSTSSDSTSYSYSSREGLLSIISVSILFCLFFCSCFC